MRTFPLFALFAVAGLALAGSPRAQASDDAVLESGKGRITFRTSCASCHGQDATGNGPVAEYLKIPPANLTTITQRNDGVFPTDRVRATIDGREKVAGHGLRDMPVWGEIFASEKGDEAAAAKLDELVAFVASIQSK
jgi:mono/diheme cytochrome c family protein